MKKIAVLTSGGDAPGMNAAIRAVTRAGLSKGIEIYGVENGFQGLVADEIFEMKRSDVSDIITKGGTILGSARLDDFKLVEIRERAVKNLQKRGIEGLIVIGGDGTFKGANALSEMGINVVGIPATIDNDITATDFTIGFDTALNTIIENVDKLRDTSASHHRCSIVEVMGNRCGDLALYAGITVGAEVVITKETGFDESEVLERLQTIDETKKKRHAIVVISEKITDVELFAQKVSQNTGFSGRSTVLGHIQRGCSPTARDRIIGTQYGDFALTTLLSGETGKCVCIRDDKFVTMDIDVALNITKKSRKELFELHSRLV
ncbi:MAG TPA: 6-phosphofructokinase [Erysipelothrix sp.]|nr:6-phosphofructokinase [Erysipelothrix sp.]